jgi:hypothetical protein
VDIQHAWERLKIDNKVLIGNSENERRLEKCRRTRADIKIDHETRGVGTCEWIHLALHADWLWAVATKVMNQRVS